jgi:hypothetical protein
MPAESRAIELGAWMDEETTRGYEVVYREAIRALDLQRNAFDTLRARVGFLLSAATIATSFLGGLALRDRSDAGSWIALGSRDDLPRPGLVRRGGP